MPISSAIDGKSSVPSSTAGEGSPLDVVFQIPGTAMIAERLGRAEVRRRLLHMTPGLLPLVLSFYPHQYPWELPVRIWVAGLAIALAFFGLKHFRSVERTGERGGNDSVLGYSYSVLATLAIAPAHPEYTLIVLCILAFGDGCATLGGMLLRGPTLFWNRHKTWAGLFSFWASGTLVSALAYWSEVVPQVTWGEAFAVGAGITLAAAIAESLPLRMNDNFRVGVATIVACFAVVEQQYIPLRMLCIGVAAVWVYRWIRRHQAAEGVDVRH